MGYIIDFELTTPPPIRRTRHAEPFSCIAEFTPLVPHAVAEAVHEEASVWLRTELPRSWISELAAKADTVARRNRQFRRLIQRSGDAGRDWLWAFMRHWLSAKILAHDRSLHQLLPSTYASGGELPRHEQEDPRSSAA